MPAHDIPEPIRALAEQRASARRAHDWATADRLKGELEAQGWRVVDAASLYTLERAAPPDLTVDGAVHYGSSATVPSRLGEAPTAVAGVVLVATDPPDGLARTVDAIRTASPGTQVVVVANGPSEDQAASLVGLDAEVEVVWLAARLGHAAALNAGIRRIAARVVVLFDPRVGVAGDVIGPLVAALDDPTVAVAGPIGLVTEDLVRYEAAPEGRLDAVAIDGRALAFRREDYVERGPLDEHFAAADYLDVWWSLILRDVSEDAGPEAAPRRAVVVPVAIAAPEGAGPATDERTAKRARYRYLKWFATRRDLLVGRPG
jgi:hypothetical protein